MQKSKTPKRLSSLEKAKMLMGVCFELTAGKSGVDAGRIMSAAVSVYENLLRADECSMSTDGGRQERQHWQQEAIVSCKVLDALFELGSPEPELFADVRALIAEVRCMAAAWRNGERRQENLKGGAR